MNSDFNQTPREEQEARLTALVLGELDASEAEAVRQGLAADPELARMHRQIEATVGLVRQAAAQPVLPAGEATEWPRMAPEKREAVLRRLQEAPGSQPTSTSDGTASPARIIPVEFGEDAPPDGRGWNGLWLLAAACGVAVLAFPSLVPHIFQSRFGTVMARHDTMSDFVEVDAPTELWRLAPQANAPRVAAGSQAGGGRAAGAAASEAQVLLEERLEADSFHEQAGQAPANRALARLGDAGEIQAGTLPQAASAKWTFERLAEQLASAASSGPGDGKSRKDLPALGIVAPAGGGAPVTSVPEPTMEQNRPVMLRRYGLAPAGPPPPAAPTVRARSLSSLPTMEAAPASGPASVTAPGTPAIPPPPAPAPAAEPAAVAAVTALNFDADRPVAFSAAVDAKASNPSVVRDLLESRTARSQRIDDESLDRMSVGALDGGLARGRPQRTEAEGVDRREGIVGQPGTAGAQVYYSLAAPAQDFGFVAWDKESAPAKEAEAGAPQDLALPFGGRPAAGRRAGGFGGGGGGGVGGGAGLPVEWAEAAARDSSPVDGFALLPSREKLAEAESVLRQNTRQPQAAPAFGDRPALGELLGSVAAAPGAVPDMSDRAAGSVAAVNGVVSAPVPDSLSPESAGRLVVHGFDVAGEAARTLDDLSLTSLADGAVDALSDVNGRGAEVKLGIKAEAPVSGSGSPARESEFRFRGATPLGGTVELAKQKAEITTDTNGGDKAPPLAGKPVPTESLSQKQDAPAAAATHAALLGRAGAEGFGLATQVPLAAPAPAPVPQAEVSTAENAFSTFSLNVSDVSFKLAQASLENGQLPAPNSVRVEEFLNALQYRDPDPVGGAPIAFAWERARHPFAHDRDLLRLSVRTAAKGRESGRPLNLVLALDNSGSMERADRVRILHEAIKVLAGKLGPGDKVSVVSFARTARLWLDGLPGNRVDEMLEAVGNLSPEGGTNLEDALRVAYEAAFKNFSANGVNRVVLLTDGAANLGDVDPASLKRTVEANRRRGVALDAFGIGWEGLNDDLLEELTRNGDGRYGFVNSPEEATTEFANQLAGALQVAAADVKVQVEFNPRRVTGWRQVGYAKHQLKKEQFRDNTVDAAELGAAESGNALYVLETNPAGDGPLGTVRVRFRVPETGVYQEREWVMPHHGFAIPVAAAGPAMRLAVSAASFGEWLARSPYAGEVSPEKLLGLVSGLPPMFQPDPRPAQLEAMLRQAGAVGR